MPVTLSSAGLFPDRRGKGGHTDLMTTSYLLMASPSELLRSRCPFPTTTQRRHFRLPWEQGDETWKEPLLWLHLALLSSSAPGPLSPCFPWTVQTPSRFSCVRFCASPWTVARQASLSMGFSKQENWSGLPFPSPGYLPDPGIEPKSPAAPAFIFHILFDYLSRLCQVLAVVCGI